MVRIKEFRYVWGKLHLLIGILCFNLNTAWLIISNWVCSHFVHKSVWLKHPENIWINIYINATHQIYDTFCLIRYIFIQKIFKKSKRTEIHLIVSKYFKISLKKRNKVVKIKYFYLCIYRHVTQKLEYIRKVKKLLNNAMRSSKLQATSGYIIRNYPRILFGN